MYRHFKTLLYVISLILLISLSSVHFSNASIYMPNEKKDVYIYIDSFGNTTTAEVDRSAGSKWNHWTEFAGFGPVWVWTNKWSELIYVYANSRIQLFADFDAPVGEKWYIDIGPCNREVYAVLAARQEEVKVPAGNFKDCIRMDLKTSCMDAGVESIWFAPKVGVVKWISQSIAGPIPREFKEGVVGGIAYPKPIPLALPLKGGTDRFEYFINMMPPIDPLREPVLLHGGLSISNNSGGSVEFIFGACEFDIYIYDQDGNMVSHMNRGNNTCFAEIAVRKILEEGETWKYSGDVELTDSKGNDLPEGDYRVECVIEATPRFSTSHTIKIIYTY